MFAHHPHLGRLVVHIQDGDLQLRVRRVQCGDAVRLQLILCLDLHDHQPLTVVVEGVRFGRANRASRRRNAQIGQTDDAVTV